MTRLTYDEFCDAVWAAMLIPHACTDQHWQIIGGEFLVNFYPYAMHGSSFYVNGSKGKRGTLAEAIAAAHNPPAINVFDKPAPYKKKYQARIRKLLWFPGCRCHWCNRRLKKITDATIDHKIPRAKGGTNSQDNLVLACLNCNQDKGNQMPQEYVKRRELVPLW